MSATRTPAKMTAAMTPTTSDSTTIGSSELIQKNPTRCAAFGCPALGGPGPGAGKARPGQVLSRGGGAGHAPAAGQDQREREGDERDPAEDEQPDRRIR